MSVESEHLNVESQHAIESQHPSIESRHLSVVIAAPVDVVYDYVVNPANLSSWASGLSSSTTLIDGRWEADSPMGRVQVSFAPRNAFGVLDHDVTLPSGEVAANPVRVIAHPDGAELIFTLRRAPGTSSEAFARDAAAVIADLATLRSLLEPRQRTGASTRADS